MSLTQRQRQRPVAPGDERGTQGASLDAVDREHVGVELWTVAALAVAVGVVLRFVARTPLWLDEALSANIAALPIGEIPDALRHDGHPPLYYLMLHGWMQVFGSSDIAVRALSGVFSVLTLPLAWLAARRRGGRVLGVVAVAIMAMAPFALRYATETRMYALVMLLVFAGYLLLDDVVRRGRRSWPELVALALVVAALLYSHYWSIYLLAAVGVVLVWHAVRGEHALASGARRAIVAMVAGGLLFIPWLPVMLYQSTHTGTPWATPQRPTSILAVTLADFGGGGFRDAEFVGVVLAVLFLLGLFGRALATDRIELDLRTAPQFRSEAAVVGLTFAIGSVVAYATASAYASRYAAVLFPIFVLVVAGGVSRFVDRRIRLGVLAALLLLSVMGAWYATSEPRTQAEQFASSVADHARPGDLVIYCPDQLGPAGARAMPSDLDQVVFPDFSSPERVDWVDYVDRHAAADPTEFATTAVERAGGRGVFLVWNGEYRGLEGKCEGVLDGLSALRGGGQVLVPDGGADYFEHAQLVWFPPPT